MLVVESKMFLRYEWWSGQNKSTRSGRGVSMLGMLETNGATIGCVATEFGSFDVEWRMLFAIYASGQSF